MGLINQILSTILMATVVLCYDEVKFEVDDSLIGKVCPAGRMLFAGTVTSFLSCAVASEEVGSAGFAYIKGTFMCYGCDLISLFQTGDFQTLPKAVFYRRILIPASDFINVGGYLLKIVKTLVDYDAAESACAEYGGLVKIDTEEKQLAIESFLLDVNNGFNGLSYWIQGRLANNNQWTFDDGSPMPMSSIFWAPGEPNHFQFHCCDMWSSMNYKWDNARCRAEFAYICELTPSGMAGGGGMGGGG